MVVDRVRVHAWAGQHPLLLFGPVLLVTVAGAIRSRRRLRAFRKPPLRAAATAGGVLLVASAVNTTVQTLVALSATGLTPAAGITEVFVLVLLAAGLWVLRAETGALGRRRRLGLAAAGFLGLATWAGFVVGPLALLAVAVAPQRWADGPSGG